MNSVWLSDEEIIRITDEEFNSLLPTNSTGSKNVTVIGTCAINEWNGELSPQLVMVDYEIVEKENNSILDSWGF